MDTPGSTSPRAPTLPAWAGIAAFVLGVLGMGVGAALAPRAGAVGVRAFLVAAELGLVLPALLLALALRRPVSAAFGLRPVTRGEAALSCALGAALWAASLGLMQIQATLWPPSAEFLDIFRRLHAALKPEGPLDAMASVVAIAVFPAVCEEIVLRGALLPGLRRGLGAAGAVAASALVFGLIHVDQAQGASAWFRVPFTVLVGVVLGALRLWTGSLVPPILAHAVLNTITFATVALSGAADAPPETKPEPVLGAALLAVGGGATAFLFRKMRRR
jgi:membrane protease YdiL (CAAX protease family)